MSGSGPWRRSGKNTPLRSWCDIGFVDRAFRVVAYAGGTSFILGWLVEVWLTGAAIQQPRTAAGVYRNAWPFKGRIAYLTDNQVAWAHYADLLLYGWSLAAFGMAWTLFVEQKAEQERIEKILRSYEPKSDN